MIGRHVKFEGALILEHLVAVLAGDRAAHVSVAHVPPRILHVGEHAATELTYKAAATIWLAGQAGVQVKIQISESAAGPTFA